MHWYLIHSKPRQEKCALENLERQGYACYLPMLATEKLRQRILTIGEEPLFPRYLFIQLGSGLLAKSWSPIRSTKGVSHLVRFGNNPARVEAALIDALRARESALKDQPKQRFAAGERICLTEGAFAGIEGIYQMSDGESRVMVLIELLGKQATLSVSPADLRKAS
ncbi:transcription antitermination protein RfaH [Betaproteobacteria bacterium]|nr:transcription antitermination protein RfaH [Betaproteobacteria bacterium]